MTKSRSELLFEHAVKHATPFSTTFGHPWAVIPDRLGRYHGWPIDSIRFREWLAHSFHCEHGIFPGWHALSSSIRVFSAHAQHSDFPASQIFTRLGWLGERRNPHTVLLNLANAANDVVHIDARGYDVAPAESWRFLCGAATEPLPRPVKSSSSPHDRLQSILGLPDSVIDRAVMWLIAAMRPAGPYPVLLLTGPASSGKSTLARSLRALLDPSAAPLLSPPATEHDLFALALHNRVLAFDQVTSLPRPIADSLARVSSGAGLGICKRNMFDHPQPLFLERPIVIAATTPHPSFTRNAIHIPLEALTPARMRTESSLANALEAAAPAILGGLCAAVSCALANLAGADPAPVTRFPDTHQWATAAAPALGMANEDISRALAANPLVESIHELLQSHPDWIGTPTDLHHALASAGAAIPATPKSLSEALNATPFTVFGISYTAWKGHRSRLIKLSRIAPSFVREATA